MDKKTILVTGSNGLLGQKIVNQLKEREDVHLIATSKGENRRLVKDFNYESLDITSEKEVEEIIAKHNPDVVINTAAMTNVDACEDHQEECWDINVNAVGYLLQSSKKQNSHFIHLSTDFVFDGENGPYIETDKPNPLSYYAKSKLASEELIEQSGYEKTAIARTIIVFGTGDNLSRGNLIMWAKGALEKQSPINVVDDQYRAPTLAEDLAKGCIAIADKDANGIFHLSGPETMSILEIVKRIGKHYNLSTDCLTPIKTAILNQTAARPSRTGFIIDKAKRELGYNPLTLEQSLEFLDNQN